MAFFVTRDGDESGLEPLAVPSAEAESPTAPDEMSDPPSVSIDELPIEGAKKKH
jgi:hypothetical protein